MVHSMTAFARASREADWGSLELELRSVNQRYLDLHFRLPETLRSLEPDYRDALRQRLNRGKVECTLRFVPTNGETLSINAERLGGLAEALGELRRTVPEAAMPDALALLEHPGVLESGGPDIAEVADSAQALFDEALDALLEARAREGAELAALIRSRLSAVREQVDEVKAQLPEILKRQRDQLLARLETVRAELEPQRLEAELTLMAQKADVDEELDRLATHVDEVERQLTLKGPVGRRLDFLMQELNREANTLSSKSVVAETTRSAVELKVLIEQMREQIQNIE
ncbi:MULTISPECIES: YicC/YloC family endoribonuclease [Halomonadaceae]|uniref:YicC/YloC family endoribonuclease n=1 Tax=Halomonadaceae TaxID=28256 RepID=UPI0015828FF1|nr:MULTISPECIES: YicC/YloC family endoribonuclease [Halomonas]MDI4638902.1 YicC family protein [Halomonas sp. BMC7]NUJ59892.1 YicC family protein [Halomonas taeanensis]|tara:strand:+ start:39304 stop:40164 length:861 start_codon:yes stop_codon:yes gene_type:complete